MLKFLRKYNKWILVVGGSLLMIAFLVPQGIQQMGSHKRGQVVAHVGEREYRQLDIQEAAAEAQLASSLWGIRVEDGNTAAHWLLLTHAAERAGLFGGEAEGRAMFDGVADQIAARFGQRPTVESLARNFNLQHTGKVYEALARAVSVQRLQAAHYSAAVLSDRKAAAAVKALADRAVVDLVLVTGALADQDNAPPDEASLQEQFTQYRAVRRGEGDYGFGYLLPPRLKLEWMVLDREAIEAGVVVDPVDVNKRWRADRARYAGEFEAEKARVEADIRAEVVDRAVRAAHDAVKAEVYNATKALAPDGRFKKLPPDWARPRWEQIAQAVVQRVNSGQNTETSHVVMPLPTVVVREAEWATGEDLFNDPDLSGATVRVGQQTASLASVLLQTREINTTPQLAVQVGVPPVDLYATRGGDRIYFTVTDARPESAPDTLDEVRDRVVADVRALRGLMALTADHSLYRDMAAESGLQAIVNYFALAQPSPDAGPRPDPPQVKERVSVSREWDGGALPADDPKFREAVLERAALLDPLDPVEETAPAYRTHAVVSQKNVGLVVFIIRGVEPLTIEDFRVTGWRMQQVLQNEFTAGGELQDPFAYKALAQRFGWRWIGAEDKPQEGDDPAGAPDTTAQR